MIYTVTSTLPPIHGGRTKALLNRIKLIDENLKIKTKILTTNYNPNYLDVYQGYLEKEKVTKRTEFENIYDWLSGFKLLVEPKSKYRKRTKYNTFNREIKGLKSEEFQNGNVVRYYDGNDYVLYRKFYDGTDILEFEDVMQPISKRKIERREYNLFGKLHKKSFFSARTYHKILEEFYDVEGRIYCKKFYNCSNTNQLDHIDVYKDDQYTKAFKTDKDLFQYYFEHRFKEGDTVFNDARLLDQPLLKIKQNTKNILVFHNSHLEGDIVKSSYRYALENSNKVSQYILLTKLQKQDIQQAYNIADAKIIVLPHFIARYKNKKVDKLDRFIFIGRLGTQKQLDHLIKAYHGFLSKGYNTRLDIYGRDEENQKQLILDLIQEYNIEDKVKIYDFTESPLDEFRKSKASLMTSKFEGFGLTVMESIEVGCPVISYDVRYGPGEIIENGANGYLVEADNIEAFSEAMVKIIEHPLEKVETNPLLRKKQAIKNYKMLFDKLKVKMS